MRLYMCACERCGKEVPATLAGYAKMVLRNSARIDGEARALCPECAESLRAWFLAGAMTNWEHLFGTPERAIHTEVEFHSWPFSIAVYETSRMSSCTTSKQLLASFCEEADYLEWLKADYDDGTVEWEER